MPWAMSRSSSRAVATSLFTGARAAGQAGVGPGGLVQVVADHEQPLLRAVVQVALEPESFGVTPRDDPFAAGAQLVEVGAQVGLQPFVVDRHPGGRAQGGGEGIGVRRLVGDDRHRGAGANQDRGRLTAFMRAVTGVSLASPVAGCPPMG